jgi:hypothetical protein
MPRFPKGIQQLRPLHKGQQGEKTKFDNIRMVPLLHFYRELMIFFLQFRKLSKPVTRNQYLRKLKSILSYLHYTNFMRGEKTRIGVKFQRCSHKIYTLPFTVISQNKTVKLQQ